MSLLYVKGNSNISFTYASVLCKLYYRLKLREVVEFHCTTFSYLLVAQRAVWNSLSVVIRF